MVQRVPARYQCSLFLFASTSVKSLLYPDQRHAIMFNFPNVPQFGQFILHNNWYCVQTLETVHKLLWLEPMMHSLSSMCPYHSEGKKLHSKQHPVTNVSKWLPDKTYTKCTLRKTTLRLVLVKLAKAECHCQRFHRKDLPPLLQWNAFIYIQEVIVSISSSFPHQH